MFSSIQYILDYCLGLFGFARNGLCNVNAILTLELIVQHTQVDLVVIEGMGRAIHTNLYARFRVDSLKVAVIKNGWLARRLGGQLYSVVFKFEPVHGTREDTPTTSADVTKYGRNVNSGTRIMKTNSSTPDRADNLIQG